MAWTLVRDRFPAERGLYVCGLRGQNEWELLLWDGEDWEDQQYGFKWSGRKNGKIFCWTDPTDTPFPPFPKITKKHKKPQPHEVEKLFLEAKKQIRIRLTPDMTLRNEPERTQVTRDEWGFLDVSDRVRSRRTPRYPSLSELDGDNING
jgi:hypothetical protein